LRNQPIGQELPVAAMFVNQSGQNEQFKKIGLSEKRIACCGIVC
jgi:hypothetical protein